MKRENEELDRSNQNLLNRREFVSRSAIIGTGFAFGSVMLNACSNLAKNESDTSNNSVQTLHGMKTRNLGNMKVSELGAGCMSISTNYGPPAAREEGLKLIAASAEKELFIIKGATHMDLYDGKEYVPQVAQKMKAFFEKNL